MRADIPAPVRELDAKDALKDFRARFALPPGIIYLDGNSLGAMPTAAAPRLEEVIRREWGEGLIRSWNDHDWVGASRRVADKIAGLIGARPGEVVVADSTSVNLFKLLMAALAARPGRKTILSEAGNFPTDLYIAQGVAALSPGLSVRAVATEELFESIDDDVAVLLLTHVLYKTGHKHDMARLTRRAHECGALALWDLSHSTGAVAVDLGAADADLAIGCGYKYLNGGPGAPAFLYVASRLQKDLQSPITGWFGHSEPFAFAGEYQPAPDINRFLSGTPPILGLMALEVGVDLLAQAPRDLLFQKSRDLCSRFIEWTDPAHEFGLELVTPRDPGARGSHVSLSHPDGYAIVQALIAEGIIGDFRAPDILRFGFAPLYLSFADVWQAASALREVLATRKWDEPRFRKRARVT
ncbi:MAG TPA: kynureninase [Rhizomicrobium sp.]|jgi:kynureninase|nr:kynureninase [Rhizomicrobium sp.]